MNAQCSHNTRLQSSASFFYYLSPSFIFSLSHLPLAFPFICQAAHVEILTHDPLGAKAHYGRGTGAFE